MSNYEILLQTVNSLKRSQGFYSRLARDLDEMDEESKEQLKTEINGLPQWNNTVDCVLWLER